MGNKLINEFKRIGLASLINFIFKNSLVFLFFDYLSFDPVRYYKYVISVVFIFSFFTSLKIGFQKTFKKEYLVKFFGAMLILLVVENYIFQVFEVYFDIKVYLSILLSMFMYIIRFLLQKLYIFK